VDEPRSFYHADGNGNITYMLNSSQSKVAEYRYDPFGNTVSQSGTLAEANVYRFSSKGIHVNSGMYFVANCPTTVVDSHVFPTLALCVNEKAIRAFGVFTFLLLLLLPLRAAADGKVFPPAAFPANVTIPDQRALIHFTNGTERLVIETRFTGSGTNFAWVVPLPNQPLIEEASTGLFPTLQYLFQPEVRHTIPRLYMAILSGVVLVWLLSRRVVRSPIMVAVLFLLCGLLASLLLPALAKGKAGGTDSGSPGVSILERKLVGVFETTTISSRDPAALQSWLRENGFVVSTNSGPVIASYVKDGWVFVAAKVRRDRDIAETATTHPLSFTFKTEKPVYPMRLTGVDNGPVQVELYVFGPSRAKARYFKTERCTRPGYPLMVPDRTPDFRIRSPASPNIVHPLLRNWVDGSPAATKLSARLTPQQMRQDVWIEWITFAEKKHTLYSHKGAATLAGNWAAGMLAMGMGVIWIRRAKTGSPQVLKRAGNLVLASLALGGAIFLALPKVDVRLTRWPGMQTINNLRHLSSLASGVEPATRGEVLAEINGFIASERAISSGEPARRWFENRLLGGLIREEDSPGNFILREHAGELQFVAYDAQGGESVMMVMPLRAEEDRKR
jgi:hypothetical protein